MLQTTRRPASQTVRNRRPGIVLLVALVGMIGPQACSTVKVRIRPDDVTKDGIASTKVMRVLPVLPPNPLPAFADSGAVLLKSGTRLLHRNAGRDAAAYFIKAAYDSQELLASRRLRDDPATESALLEFHNSALARFAETWTTDSRRLDGQPPVFTIDGHTYEVVLDKNSDYPEGYFDRVIPSESISGKGVVETDRSGYGASLVAIREQRPERAEEMLFHSRSGIHVPVTLVMGDPIKMGGPASPVVRVPVSMMNPMLHDHFKVRGFNPQLAADFSAPLEVLLNRRSQNSESIAGFFDASKRIKNSGIFLIEPYDPKRIPVILTHGLVSVPIIWRDVIAELMANPEISRRYQFGVFTYPSSYALSESALLFREQLAAIREHHDPEGDDPLSNDVVAIGHSMGGMLTHLLVAETGDNLWNQVSDKPLDEMGWSPEITEKVRKLAYFEPDPAVHRAIFIAAPHGGATKANKGIATFVSRFAKLPSTLLSTATNLLTPSDTADLKIDLDKKVTSIQSLSPESAIVKALAISPYRKRVVYHSIIGDRGKGDTPNSSDGLVEYWSSHQEGAASELIVPTDHGAYKSPLAVAELERILLLHVGIQ